MIQTHPILHSDVYLPPVCQYILEIFMSLYWWDSTITSIAMKDLEEVVPNIMDWSTHFPDQCGGTSHTWGVWF